jgi:uncharacterized protein
MTYVFADTHYWIAVTVPGDSWAEAAKKARSKIKNAVLLTTDEVLAEYATALSSYGPTLRHQAVRAIKEIMKNPNVRVIPQTRDSFLKGLQLYEQRPDKEYSLVDCISMNAMTAENIRSVLTNDHHFEQEGFIVLIKD